MEFDLASFDKTALNFRAENFCYGRVFESAKCTKTL